MKRTIITSIFIAVLSVAALPVSSAFAANPASFSLAPSAGSVVKGNSFTISVSENGDNVSAVKTVLTYNSAQLQQVSATCGGSFPSSVGDGQNCFITPGGAVINGSAFVMSVTFKALSDTGSASISVAAGSQIASNGSNIWSGNSSLVSVALTAPAAPTPAQPTPGGSPSTGSTGGSSSSATGSTNSASNTSSTGSTTTQATNGSTGPSTATSTTPEGSTEVKAASITKTVAAVPTNPSGINTKTLTTVLLPFLIGLIVFIALTYPVIISNLKKAKITTLVRQKLAKITNK